MFCAEPVLDISGFGALPDFEGATLPCPSLHTAGPPACQACLASAEDTAKVLVPGPAPLPCLQHSCRPAQLLPLIPGEAPLIPGPPGQLPNQNLLFICAFPSPKSSRAVEPEAFSGQTGGRSPEPCRGRLRTASLQAGKTGPGHPDSFLCSMNVPTGPIQPS